MPPTLVEGDQPCQVVFITLRNYLEIVRGNIFAGPGGTASRSVSSGSKKSSRSKGSVHGGSGIALAFASSLECFQGLFVPRFERLQFFGGKLVTQ